MSEFSESCEKAKKQMELQIVQNITKCCLLVERTAKQNCTVDQGPLRASMGYDVNIIFGEVIGRVVNTMEYAPYVHQGTGIYTKNGEGRKTPWKYKVEARKYKGCHKPVGQRPQPFLESSKTCNIAKIQNILGEGLR